MNNVINLQEYRDNLMRKKIAEVTTCVEDQELLFEDIKNNLFFIDKKE